MNDPATKRGQERLDALLDGLAHEIKNPLSTINLNLELLREDWSAERTAVGRRSVEKIDVLMQECRRLERMLSDFVRLSANAEPEIVRQDVNVLVEDVVDFMAARCREVGVVTSEQFDRSLPPVPLDASLFRQALVNLIRNAVDAMPRGGTLTVQTRREPAGVAIDVIDTGEGISEKTLARIFDAYFSTKPDGAGLGLTTARRIVELHGGTVEAQSAAGRGTLLVVRLPFASDEGVAG